MPLESRVSTHTRGVHLPTVSPVAEEGARSMTVTDKQAAMVGVGAVATLAVTERCLDFSGAGTLYVLARVWTAHVLSL